ncbi:MAG: outer membrane lipoprotein-sorting protein [Proteobacteria bacterium]|nr:outer membrane lipoprotein-sorting protein [Pseudomonadota bacterium]
MLALLTALAFADDASDLLSRIDEAAKRGDDLHLALSIETTDRRGQTVQRAMDIWQKGDEKRLIRFAEPERLSGISLLVPDGETVYLYLPAYGKARRIVGKARGDAFIGTDFAMEDLARLSWSTEYVATKTGENALTLTPADGAKPASPRVDLVVRAEDALPTTVEHFDASGAVVRRIQFSDYRDVDGRFVAHSVVVTDVTHTRSTHATVTEVAFDQGLEDDRFRLDALSH